MPQWTPLDPGLGDTSPIDELAARLGRDGESASEIASVLTAALRSLDSFWRGAGATVWVGAASRQRGDLAEFEGAADEVARAARRYSAAVDDIGRLAKAQAALLASGEQGMGQTYLDDPSAPPSDDILRQRTQDHDAAAHDAATATQALARLAEQRQHADDAFVRAVHSALPLTWPAQRRAFAALGIAHPDRVSVRDIDRRVDDYLRQLRSRNDYSAEDASTLLVFAERGDVSPDDVTALLTKRPALAACLSKVDPNVVAAWWRGLGGSFAGGVGGAGGGAAGGLASRSAAQVALVVAIPDVLGNLDGVAYWARDTANRAVLTTTLASTESELEHLVAQGMPGQPDLAILYRDRLSTLRLRRDSLRAVRRSLVTPGKHQAPRQLISLNLVDPPLAAISIGDIDSADNVTYMIPGMGSSTLDMQSWVRATQNVQTEQATVEASRNSAVVAWVGYKSPPQPSLEHLDLGVLFSRSALAGSEALVGDLGGLNAVRTGSHLHLNVVAHSYGTTTATLALASHDLHIESFVSVASAGIDKSIPTAATIRATHVFAEQAEDVIPGLEQGEGDEWAWTGRVGSGRTNPMDPSFGAETFDSDATGGRGGAAAVTSHSGLVHIEGDESSGFGYFDTGTGSITNIALATTGQGGALLRAKPSAPTPLQPYLLEVVTRGGYSP